jgi:hypothetical protein
MPLISGGVNNVTVNGALFTESVLFAEIFVFGLFMIYLVWVDQ